MLIVALARNFIERRSWLLPASLCLVMVGLPLVGIDRFTAREVETVAIFTLLVSSLNLTLGFAGELAFGQIAMFAAGAYLTGYLSVEFDTDLVVTLTASALVGTAIAFVTGVPALRLGGWGLAMVTFFLVLLIPDILNITIKYTGGGAGLTGISFPRFGGLQLDDTTFYLAVVVMASIWMVFMRNFITSRHGTALQVMRESPILAASLGIRTVRLKLMVYVIGGVPAGLAGCLFAYLNRIVAPESFGFSATVGILAASILGGMVSAYGAILGSIFIEIIPLRFIAFQQYSGVVYGIFLVLGGLLLPEGAAGLGKRYWQRVRPTRPPRITSQTNFLRGAKGKDMYVSDLSVAFGGVKALDHVSLELKAGQITAIIGPNGSGKTTLLNTASGFVKPTGGFITVGDHRITRQSPYKVARAGVSRTFQTPVMPARMPVIDVVGVARYVHPYRGILSAALRTRTYRQTRREDEQVAFEALRTVGISEEAERMSGDLPLGTRRLIEVARALTSRPSVVLLDEPASGLNSKEVDALADLLRQLKAAGTAVVLVEHNFRFVVSVADVIHVLHLGRVLVSGSPDLVARNEHVIRVYLGTASGSAVTGSAPDQLLEEDRNS